jgi:hypothetical protein
MMGSMISQKIAEFDWILASFTWEFVAWREEEESIEEEFKLTRTHFRLKNILNLTHSCWGNNTNEKTSFPTWIIWRRSEHEHIQPEGPTDGGREVHLKLVWDESCWSSIHWSVGIVVVAFHEGYRRYRIPWQGIAEFSPKVEDEGTEKSCTSQGGSSVWRKPHPPLELKSIHLDRRELWLQRKFVEHWGQTTEWSPIPDKFSSLGLFGEDFWKSYSPGMANKITIRWKNCLQMISNVRGEVESETGESMEERLFKFDGDQFRGWFLWHLALGEQRVTARVVHDEKYSCEISGVIVRSIWLTKMGARRHSWRHSERSPEGPWGRVSCSCERTTWSQGLHRTSIEEGPALRKRSAKWLRISGFSARRKMWASLGLLEEGQKG